MLLVILKLPSISARVALCKVGRFEERQEIDKQAGTRKCVPPDAGTLQKRKYTIHPSSGHWPKKNPDFTKTNGHLMTYYRATLISASSMSCWSHFTTCSFSTHTPEHSSRSLLSGQAACLGKSLCPNHPLLPSLGVWALPYSWAVQTDSWRDISDPFQR